MMRRCGEAAGSHCSDRSQRGGDGRRGVDNGLLRRRLWWRRPERRAGAHVQLVAELQHLARGLQRAQQPQRRGVVDVMHLDRVRVRVRVRVRDGG